MPTHLFELRLKVRDYECDLQGIVNNANYLHYTEHTRHEFLLAHGVSFAQLHEQGIDAVVARLQMAFKRPLRSGDTFRSCLDIKREGLRYVFLHTIYRESDSQPSLRARVDTVCLTNGTLGECERINALFQRYGS